MDEVIQYRKDQKAGGGRLVYKGVKLNNRPMHNFRPTIGKHNNHTTLYWQRLIVIVTLFIMNVTKRIDFKGAHS